MKSTEQPNRNQIYEGTIDILEPEIKKLKDFMVFQRETNEKFCEYIKQFIYGKKKPSEVFMWQLVRMLDLLALLDVLKNMKASFNNDFSAYKRALGFSKKKPTSQVDQDKATQENHQLHLFLANQNSITTQLKADLEAPELEGYQDVLAHIANMCAEHFEEGRYVTPSDKFRLLRVMPYIIFLMDHADAKKSVLKCKSIKPERFAKIFKQYPIVPLYGDMQTTLVTVLQRAPNYDEETWGVGRVSDAKLSVEYEIHHSLPQARAVYTSYLARFHAVMNEIKLHLRNVSDAEESGEIPAAGPDGVVPLSPAPVPEALSREVRSLILRGYQHLTDWTGKVLAQAAWKYAHPNQDPKIETEYERYVRYNYSSSDKLALIEFIAMLKGLADSMLKEEAILVPILRASIHDEAQDFIQNQLRDLLRQLSKKADKKKGARDELLELRKLAADWTGGIEPDDPTLKGQKPAGNVPPPSIPRRAVPPSPTQLDLMRNIVYGFLTQRGKKEIFAEKDFSDKDVEALQTWYNTSFYYPYLLDYSGTIRSITDLGDLWYREFYLELTKRLQFEIDMSLAWILCDHILESGNTAMMEYLLYPLDIYNDAAQRALSSLNQRFLYDEIEAEVNLAFDQLVYKLSDQTYTYFKLKASAMQLDKDYRRQLEQAFPDKVPRYHVPKSRLEVLLRQRHLSLLGRSIDLNALISQRLNNAIRRNLHYAIARFEASPITNVVEFEILFNNIKTMHRLMSEILQLDSWESIVAEVDSSLSLASFHGRIVLHILFEFVSDLTPNFLFNGITKRFVRAASLGREEEAVPREAQPKPNLQFLFGSKMLTQAYSAVGELTANFFGLPHLHACLRLIGKSSVALLTEQLLQNMDLKLHNVLEPYFNQLAAGMPSDKSSLPQYEYGTYAAFEYFRAKLKDIIDYPVLVPEAFQHFREWGNAVVLLLLLDTATVELDAASAVHASYFLGVIPDRPHAKKSLSQPNDLFNLSAVAAVSSAGSSPLCKTAKSLKTTLERVKDGISLGKAPAMVPFIVEEAGRAERVYRPSSNSHSLFKVALHGIKRMLKPFRAAWVHSVAGDVLPGDSILPIEQTKEFYRVWSALQFVFLLDVADNVHFQKPSLELFGDGIHWAGCTIIHFLGQRFRFEALDFAYHVQRMNDVLPFESVVNDERSRAAMVTFFHRLSLVRDINETCFRVLDAYLPVETSPSVSDLRPPKAESSATFLSSSSAVGDSRPSQFHAPSAPIAPPAAPIGVASPASDSFGLPPPPDAMPPPPPPPGESEDYLPEDVESEEEDSSEDGDAPPAPFDPDSVPPPPPAW